MSAQGRVAIHVNGFPLPSEAFVLEQARSLVRFEPVMFVRRQLGAVEGLACKPIMAGRHGWPAKAFALHPGTWAWGGPSAFEGVRLIHAHFGPNGVYALPIARALKVPLVVTFHGFDATLRRAELVHAGMFGLRYVLGLPRLRRKATKVIAVSKFLETRLRAMGFPEASIVQHYIGVDPDRFSPLAPAARSLDVVCVARMVAAKGIEELIRAFGRIAARFPESRLRLIGGGPRQAGFGDLARALGLGERVVFHGAVAHREVARIVSGCALSVLASKAGVNGWKEAFGLGSIEAAAAGLPVIVSRNGGLVETVEDGVTGCVIGEGSVDELAAALALFLADAGLRERFGAAGRVRVLERFDLRKQTAMLEDIYAAAIDTANN